MVLPAGDDYADRKAVWEAAGFTRFKEPAQPGLTEEPEEQASGFVYTLLDGYTLAVAWAGEKNPPMQVEIPATGEVDGVPYRVSQVAPHGFEGQPIESVSVPSSVTAIGEAAFQGCNSLASISLSEGLAFIGASAFEDCGVDALMLPASVTSIGERTFADCSSLARIVALSEIPAVADSSIVGCSGVSIVCPYSDSGEYAWNPGLVANGNHIDPYGLKLCPDPLTLEVGQSADLFEDGVCEVPEGAELAYAYSAVPLSVDTGVVTGKKEGATEVAVALELDGVELDRVLRTVEVTLAGGGDPAPVLNDAAEPNPLPDEPALLSGEAIAPRAAGDVFGSVADKVAFEVLDENVNTVVAYKYTSGSEYITTGNVVIPATVQNKNNGEWYTVTAVSSFSSCPGLTSVSIPNTVTKIENSAFQHNPVLSSVSIPSSVKEIGRYAFWDCPALSRATIPNSVTSIGVGLFYECTGLTSVALSNALTTIPDYTFYGCTKLPSVTIPDSVNALGVQSFARCVSLTSLVIPNSVTTIGSSAFANSGLVSLRYGSGVKRFDAETLGGISTLKDIYDPYAAFTSFLVGSIINQSAITLHLPNDAKNLGGWKSVKFTKIDASFTVTFNTQGGSAIASRLVKYGATTTAPAAPAKNGYTFGGWFKETACTNPWNFATDTNAGPMTLYAKWTPVSYNIGYNLNGGAVSIANPTSYTIETNTFTLNNPTKQGYVFVGWSGTGLTGSANKTVTIPKGSMENRSYTANWTPETYQIQYNLNGGSASGNPETYTIESNQFTLNAPTKPGYTFAGWSGTGLTGNANQTVTVPKGSVGPRTYTANWTPVTYAIDYELDGGAVSGNPPSYTIETATFTLKNPTKSGYAFTGWSGTGLAGTANQTVTVAQGSTGVRSYTAHWTPVISGTVPLAATIAVDWKGNVTGAVCGISSTSVVPIKVDSIACAEEAGAKDVFPEAAERAAIAVTLKPGNAAAVSVGLGGLLQRDRLGDFAIAANSTLSTAIDLALPNGATIKPTATDDDPDASKAFARLTYTLALA